MNNNALLMQDFLGFKLSVSLKQKANVPIIPTILRSYRPMKLSFTVILSWFILVWTRFDICTCLSMKISFEYITFKRTSSAFHLRIRNAPESYVYCRTSTPVDKAVIVGFLGNETKLFMLLSAYNLTSDGFAHKCICSSW